MACIGIGEAYAGSRSEDNIKNDLHVIGWRRNGLIWFRIKTMDDFRECGN